LLLFLPRPNEEVNEDPLASSLQHQKKKLIDEEAKNKEQKMQRTLEAKNKRLLKKSENDTTNATKARRGAKRPLSEL